jgi:hypothetical protein
MSTKKLAGMRPRKPAQGAFFARKCAKKPKEVPSRMGNVQSAIMLM